jgi:hypothetical protein
VLDPGDRGWRSALGELAAVGASTGRAYALSLGASALLLAGPP